MARQTVNGETAIGKRHPLAQAFEARDADAIPQLLALDVVFHDPVASATFRGRDQVAGVYGVLIDALEEWEWLAELVGPSSHALIYRATLAGRAVEVVDVMELGSDGQITEIRAMARPVTGMAGFVVAVGPSLGRRRSRTAGTVLTLLARPAAWFMASLDTLGSRLIRPRHQP